MIRPIILFLCFASINLDADFEGYGATKFITGKSPSTGRSEADMTMLLPPLRKEILSRLALHHATFQRAPVAVPSPMTARRMTLLSDVSSKSASGSSFMARRESQKSFSQRTGNLSSR